MTAFPVAPAIIASRLVGIVCLASGRTVGCVDIRTRAAGNKGGRRTLDPFHPAGERIPERPESWIWLHTG